jgi:hypothetical protein
MTHFENNIVMLTYLENLYNRKHQCGRLLIENAFGIMKNI